MAESSDELSPEDVEPDDDPDDDRVEVEFLRTVTRRSLEAISRAVPSSTTWIMCLSNLLWRVLVARSFSVCFRPLEFDASTFLEIVTATLGDVAISLRFVTSSRKAFRHCSLSLWIAPLAEGNCVATSANTRGSIVRLRSVALTGSCSSFSTTTFTLFASAADANSSFNSSAESKLFDATIFCLA